VRKRQPNTLNGSFEGHDGNALLARVPEIAGSIVSAYHSGRTEPSGVLLAMRRQPDSALGSVRFNRGRWVTDDEIERTAALVTYRLRAV
jgi:cysteine sulfinate desulfinase/cysteine desulfurase-like protein